MRAPHYTRLAQAAKDLAVRYTEPMPARRLLIEPYPVSEACKKDIDRTLLREHLKLSVDDRFR